MWVGAAMPGDCGRMTKLITAAGSARELPALARALPVGSTASSGIVDSIEAVLLVAEVSRCFWSDHQQMRLTAGRTTC